MKCRGVTVIEVVLDLFVIVYEGLVLVSLCSIPAFPFMQCFLECSLCPMQSSIYACLQKCQSEKSPAILRSPHLTQVVNPSEQLRIESSKYSRGLLVRCNKWLKWIRGLDSLKLLRYFTCHLCPASKVTAIHLEVSHSQTTYLGNT